MPMPTPSSPRTQAMDDLTDHAFQLVANIEHFATQNSPRASRAREFVRYLASQIDFKKQDKARGADAYKDDPLHDLIVYESDEEVSEKEKATRLTKNEKVLADLKRLQDCGHLPPLTAEEYYAEILMKRPESAEEAIMQLFRGYKAWDHTGVDKLVQQLGGTLFIPTNNKADVCQFIIDGKWECNVDRLATLDRDIKQDETALHRNAFLATVRNNLMALIFGHLWAKEWSGKGGKLRQTTYYEQAYQKSCPEFDKLDDEAARKLMGLSKHIKGLHYFKTENGKDVGARNRLWKLFNIVGYGAVVDPYWSVALLRKGARVQTVWGLANLVLTREKALGLPRQRYDETMKNFCQVLEKLDAPMANTWRMFHKIAAGSD